MGVPPDLGDERRTIDELETRYLLEPELGDVYVEGPSDAALISWFLDQHGRRNWRVYSIETVDVPAALVQARGFDVGARGRALTLGIELSERLGAVAGRKPVVIADQDTDALRFNREFVCDLCLLTDFTSMEMYAYNIRTLDKLLRLFVQTQRVRADELMEALSAALADIFVVRTVLYRAGHGISIIQDVTRCCARRSGSVEVNVEELVRRSVNASGARPRPAVEAIVSEYVALKSTIPGDVRRAVHGHDFVHLLAWFLHALGVPVSLSRDEVIGRALFSCLEVTELIEYPLFVELLRRTTS